VLAALRNALAVVGKDLADCQVVVSGVGAAGSAIIRLLQHRGPGDVVAVDIDGIVHPDRPGLDANLAAIAATTNRAGLTGGLDRAMAGADVFIGVSAPGILTEAHLASMAERPIVFALANPEPEVEPLLALRYASVVATGRSDHPNQINNVLAFPGVFRGLLDSGATEVTDAMLLAAADALADVVDPAQRSATYVVPSVFDPRVAPAVASAITAPSTTTHREVLARVS
jgi:malate dehydrogenase (oxaloacetate-decarboxylating)